MKGVIRLLHISSLISFLLLFAVTAVAQHRRVVTFHLAQPPLSDSTQALAINNHGEVAGHIGKEIGEAEGFVWSQGSFRAVFEFEFIPNSLIETSIAGINDFGQTIGMFFSSTSPDREVAFLRDKRGNTTRLPLVNGVVPIPFGINNAGIIVGVANGAGFILRSEQYTLLAYPGALGTQATAVNNTGTVVGWYSADLAAQQVAFIYADGQFKTTFQCTDGGVTQSTVPTGINDFGQIVGNCNGRMFLRDSSGTITFIDPAGLPTPSFGLPSPRVTGINNHGDITGYFADDTVGTLFRWDSFVIYRAVETQ